VTVEVMPRPRTLALIVHEIAEASTVGIDRSA